MKKCNIFITTLCSQQPLVKLVGRKHLCQPCQWLLPVFWRWHVSWPVLLWPSDDTEHTESWSCQCHTVPLPPTRGGCGPHAKTKEDIKIHVLRAFWSHAENVVQITGNALIFLRILFLKQYKKTWPGLITNGHLKYSLII